MKRKVLSKILLILTFFILLLPINCKAMVEPTREFYVNDYANILSESYHRKK